MRSALREKTSIFILRDDTRSSLIWFYLSGLSDDSSSAKDETKPDKQGTSSGGTGSKIVIICVVLVECAGLSFFLFKFWQKKKRKEQYARLLKLFEQDDELELELGLRD